MLYWVKICYLTAVALCYPSGNNHQKMCTLWFERNWRGQHQYLGRLWCLNNAQLIKSGPKSAIPFKPPAAWIVDTRQDGSILVCCLHQVLIQHPTVAVKIDSHQTRQCFFNLLLFGSFSVSPSSSYQAAKQVYLIKAHLFSYLESSTWRGSSVPVFWHCSFINGEHFCQGHICKYLITASPVSLLSTCYCCLQRHFRK